MPNSQSSDGCFQPIAPVVASTMIDPSKKMRRGVMPAAMYQLTGVPFARSSWLPGRERTRMQPTGSYARTGRRRAPRTAIRGGAANPLWRHSDIYFARNWLDF
jgi:hypothetical protein